MILTKAGTAGRKGEGMRKVLALIMIVASVGLLAGCATTGGTSSASNIQTAQQVATATLDTAQMGCSLAPTGFNVALANNAISQADYTSDLQIVARVCAGVTAARAALADAITANIDPTSSTSYLVALSSMLADQTLMNNALAAAGVTASPAAAQPAGAAK